MRNSVKILKSKPYSIKADNNFEVLSDEEPLLRWKRKRTSPKTPPPPKPTEVEDTDDNEVTTSSEKASEEQGSEHTEQRSESTKPAVKTKDFERLATEETESESPSSDHQGCATDPPVTETVSAPDVGVQSPETVSPPPPAHSAQEGSVPQNKRFKAVLDPTLEPFMTLPVRVADLENRFNTRAREMIDTDIATFRDALYKVKAEVGILQ
ncbi:uncharacterized protein LOC124898600 [Capsicum annuum]|uniref:uncharacterized protein LOC124895763 n=1 Tax=Capsicum annuum TaxID=4072 RepID=UPI001FB16543|nr:uncharacterized protein LOC124895763 [Capsicum annuum]XP_047262160.1 uncharacterized protein LOC124895776 [Capsicum annuum]XP_047262173.1 uncharacterized protein LOC124895795 [Capsicum annuum]XP_047262213.1 uncharacterized protein LOC124895854 [Capsicum annuum]XP_047268192.1 uncharacterized protein LOC124898600 [Capsicum annuum]